MWHPVPVRVVIAHGGSLLGSRHVVPPIRSNAPPRRWGALPIPISRRAPWSRLRTLAIATVLLRFAGALAWLRLAGALDAHVAGARLRHSFEQLGGLWLKVGSCCRSDRSRSPSASARSWRSCSTRVDRIRRRRRVGSWRPISASRSSTTSTSSMTSLLRSRQSVRYIARGCGGKASWWRSKSRSRTPRGSSPAISHSSAPS